MKFLTKIKRAMGAGPKRTTKPVKRPAPAIKAKSLPKKPKPKQMPKSPVKSQAKKIRQAVRSQKKQTQGKQSRAAPQQAKPSQSNSSRSGSPQSKPAQSKQLTRKQQKEFLVKQLALPQVETPAPQEKRIIKYPVLQGADNDRIRMLLPLLRELVKRGVISDWIINFSHTRANNLYSERNFIIEDEQTTLREDLLLTIYERLPDGLMGEAQLPIITTDAQAAKLQILEAKKTCEYAKKKAFNLPEPEEGIVLPQGYDQALLTSIFAGNGSTVPRAIYSHIRQQMISVQDIKVCAFEVLASAGTNRVLNSNGVDISFHRTSVYLEVILAAKGKEKEEREFVLSRTVVSPDQFDLQLLLEQQMAIVRDATIAQLNPGFTGDVLLSQQSVAEVFAPDTGANPLILHAHARLGTMGVSCLKLGQPIGHIIGEPFHLLSNPSLPLGLFTAPVDGDGTPLRPLEVYRNGVFTNWVAPARYAQYLGVPVTGNLGNVQIAPGATREQHLRSNNYFEIISFSWFNPDPFSGDFSAEVRLGHHWVNGRKTPMRGGTLVGNMFKAMCNARFSKEVMQSSSYYGPRAIVLRGATITRMDV